MYRIQLQEFEGPLDLLLFFIRRDELDIYDIPIARITEEYLQYVRLLQDLDLDQAGEFIYMAALLISIKARMLLPRPELDEDGEELDPRQELVERLLEYIRYKEAAAQLALAGEERADLFTPQAAAFERHRLVYDDVVDYKVSVYSLVTALQRVLAETEPDPAHEIEAEHYTIEAQSQFILDQLAQAESARAFSDLMAQRSKTFIITAFLAILELIRGGLVQVFTQVSPEDFYLQKS